MSSLHFKASWQLFSQTVIPSECWHVVVNFSLWSPQASGPWCITRPGFLRLPKFSVLPSLETRWPYFFLPFVSTLPPSSTLVWLSRTNLIAAKDSIVWPVLGFSVFQTVDHISKYRTTQYGCFLPVPIFWCTSFLHLFFLPASCHPTYSFSKQRTRDKCLVWT